jgi:putative hydrolase of the HAD superfamily
MKTMELTSFTALSFDCYGTLIDWDTGISAILLPWARRHGLDLNQRELLVAHAAAEGRAQRENPGDLYPDILARSFRGLGAAFGVPVTDAEAAGLGASIPDWPAFGDSPRALATLARRYKLILLSNVDRASFAASNERLHGQFSAILTAQDIGSYKPDPANFEALAAAAAGLGVGPGQLLHVAQSLYHDHVPAKQAGLPTVWINRHHDQPGWGAVPAPPVPVQPDWEFPSMEAFAEAVESAWATPGSQGTAP